MRYLLILVALAAGIAAVGYGAGWWSGSVQTTPGGVSGKVAVDGDEIAADRDRFVADVQKKLDDLDAKFAKLSADAKAETKPKYEELKKSMAKSRDQLAENLRVAKSATKEKWQDVRERTNRAWTELSDGFAKALGEIKN